MYDSASQSACSQTQLLPVISQISTQPAPSTAVGYLEGLVDGYLKKIYIEEDGKFTLGRSKACDISLDDKTVSTVHFTISTISLEDSKLCPLVIVDSSANGTCINKKRISKGEPLLLCEADAIAVQPSYHFIFRYLRGDPGKKLKEVKNYVITSYTVGNGSFATVKFALCLKSKRQCAVKIIKKNKFNLSHRMGDTKKFFTEIEIMKRLKHPNIVQILDVYDSEHLLIFLPFIAGGDLHGYITSQRDLRVSETQSCYIIMQVLFALKYLHARKIAHRDIKPENVLLMTKGDYPQALVTDFGMARVMGNTAMTSICGTFQYIAPEIIFHNNLLKSSKPSQPRKDGYDVKVDCWSAGVLLYAMISGTLPFNGDDDSEEQGLFRSICNDLIPFDDYLWDTISDHAKSLILHLIERDSHKRFSCLRALEHPWFRGQFEEFRPYLAAFLPSALEDTYDGFIKSSDHINN